MSDLSGKTALSKKAARLHLWQTSLKYGPKLVRLPPEDFPRGYPSGVLHAYRSRKFLVQIWTAPAWNSLEAVRMTVNRSELGSDGRWKAGITWDELFELKNQIFPEREAIEVYPPEKELQNIENMRHLWILPFGQSSGFSLWRKL